MNSPNSARRGVRALGAAAFAGGAAVIVVAAASPAAAASGSGVEHFVVTSVNGVANVVAYGPFTGGGAASERNSSDVLHFGNGYLVIAHPNSTQTGGSFRFNPDTCRYHGTAIGSYTLKKGTGAYTGVIGYGTYHARFDGVFGHTSDGSCDVASDPRAETSYVRASGPITFP